MSTAVIVAAAATVCAAVIVAESTALAYGDVLDDVCIAALPSLLSAAAITTVVGALSDVACQGGG